MGKRDLFSGEARAEARQAVRDVEARTSAEIVLAVRAQSASYREADYLLGFLFSVGTLLALLYLPQSFALEWFAVDVVAGFALGTLLGGFFPGLRRWLVPKARMRESVARAARAWFVDRGVTRTTGRTGILVYASVYERLVEVVADVGVLDAKLGKAWDQAVGRLRETVASGLEPTRLFTAVRELGPVLEQALPRAADDVNELPDEPSSTEEEW